MSLVCVAHHSIISRVHQICMLSDAMVVSTLLVLNRVFGAGEQGAYMSLLRNQYL